MSEEIVATIGRCIYCGATSDEVELTREHIVPFALGGTYVLEQASCADCQYHTKHIEQNVLRPMLGMARVRLGLPTRNKKERAAPFRAKIERDEGYGETVHV